MLNLDPVSNFDCALDAFADLKLQRRQRRRDNWTLILVAVASFIAGLLCSLR